MKVAIVGLCIILTVTVSKKGLGQPPAKKKPGQTTTTNQKEKTTRSGTNILMDEKNPQKEGTVPVRTNSGTHQNPSSPYKPVPQQFRREDSIISPYEKNLRDGKSPSFNDIIVSSRTSKDVPASGNKASPDSSKPKQQAELRNKPQRN